MDDKAADTRERLAAVEQDQKSVHRRLDNLEELTESIHSIAIEMRSMRTSMEQVQRDLASMHGRVEDIESKPKKRWESLIGAVFTAAATAIVGYIIGRFF